MKSETVSVVLERDVAEIFVRDLRRRHRRHKVERLANGRFRVSWSETPLDAEVPRSQFRGTSAEIHAQRREYRARLREAIRQRKPFVAPRVETAALKGSGGQP